MRGVAPGAQRRASVPTSTTSLPIAMSYSNSIAGLPSFQLSSAAPAGAGPGARVAAGLARGFAQALGQATGVQDLGLAGSVQGGAGALDQQGLFELQLQAQRELQQFTLMSNLAKTEHDTRMAAVRNMRP